MFKDSQLNKITYTIYGIKLFHYIYNCISKKRLESSQYLYELHTQLHTKK